MTEYRTVSFTVSSDALLGSNEGDVKVQTLDFVNSTPQLAEHVDGWEVVTMQIVPAGELAHLVLCLKTSVKPESSAGDVVFL